MSRRGGRSKETGSAIGPQVNRQIVEPAVAHAAQIDAERPFVEDFDIQPRDVELHAERRVDRLQAARAGRTSILQDGQQPVALERCSLVDFQRLCDDVSPRRNVNRTATFRRIERGLDGVRRVRTVAPRSEPADIERAGLQPLPAAGFRMLRGDDRAAVGF